MPARQRGWAGALGVLLTMLLVAVFVGAALKQYGASPTGTAADASASAAKGGGAAKGDRPAKGDGAAPIPLDETAPAPARAVERVRALEGSVGSQAEDLERRIDDASK